MANQNLTLANGQVISASDPNYTEYARQTGTSAVPITSQVSPQVNTAVNPTSSNQINVGGSTFNVLADSVIDPNKPMTTYNRQTGVTTESPASRVEAPAASPAITPAKQTAPVTPSIMDESMAKEYAMSKGEANWQQYVNGVDGKANPLYIGATNYKKLQSQFTPYQIEQSTIRTKDGIYWNPNVNISEVPTTSPGDMINNFSKDIADAVSYGQAKSEVTDPKGSSPDVSAESDTSVNSKDMNTAIGIFNSIMNTPGMDDLKNDVQEAKTKLDEYDQQMDELADDIRKEVAGEAPESYINALAAVRGNQIMRLRRQAERDYNTAVTNFNAEKELKTQQVNMMVNDVNNRYNRAFQMLQFEETKAQNSKSWEAVKLNAKLSLPAGTKYQFSDGTVVEGLKENDNLATGTYTDANRNVYYYAIDKTTGKEAFPQVFIGKAPATGGQTFSWERELREYDAEQALTYQKDIDAKLAAGEAAIGYDDKGKSFYYDNTLYEDKSNKNIWGNHKKDPIEFRL